LNTYFLATDLRGDDSLNTSLLRSSFLGLTVKNYRKSVNICRSRTEVIYVLETVL